MARRVRLCVTPWTAAPQASPSVTVSRSLLRLTSIESVMPSNHLILCRPLLLPPSVFPSSRVFSNESALCIIYHRWIGQCLLGLPTRTWAAGGTRLYGSCRLNVASENWQVYRVITDHPMSLGRVGLTAGSQLATGWSTLGFRSSLGFICCFLFSTKWSLSAWTYPSSLTSSPTEGCVCCFQISAVMNKSAASIPVGDIHCACGVLYPAEVLKLMSCLTGPCTKSTEGKCPPDIPN